MPLIKESRRYYDYEPRRKRSLDRRPRRPLARAIDSPLKLLVLVGVGAAIAQFVPAIWCMLIQFASVLALGGVGWWCWQLFRRR